MNHTRHIAHIMCKECVHLKGILEGGPYYTIECTNGDGYLPDGLVGFQFVRQSVQHRWMNLDQCYSTDGVAKGCRISNTDNPDYPLGNKLIQTGSHNGTTENRSSQ